MRLPEWCGLEDSASFRRGGLLLDVRCAPLAHGETSPSSRRAEPHADIVDCRGGRRTSSGAGCRAFLTSAQCGERDVAGLEYAVPRTAAATSARCPGGRAGWWSTTTAQSLVAQRTFPASWASLCTASNRPRHRERICAQDRQWPFRLLARQLALCRYPLRQQPGQSATGRESSPPAIRQLRSTTSPGGMLLQFAGKAFSAASVRRKADQFCGW